MNMWTTSQIAQAIRMMMCAALTLATGASLSACGKAAAEPSATEVMVQLLGLPEEGLPQSADAWGQHVTERNLRCSDENKVQLTGPRRCVKSARDFLSSAGLSRPEQQEFMPGQTGAKQVGEYVRDHANKLPAGWRIKELKAGEAIDPKLGGLVFYGCQVAGRPLGHVTTVANGKVYDNYTRGSANKICPGTKRKGEAYDPGEEYCSQVAFLQLYHEAWVTP
jgi:hypothetical protein